MKQILSFVIVLFFLFNVHYANGQNCGCVAPPQICEKNIVTDFNATTSNAQFAFERASQFINQRGGYVKLIIPSGTYLVGKQNLTPTSSEWLFEGVPVLNLKACTKVEIVGVGPTRPVLKFFDKMYFGMFDKTCFTPIQTSDQSYSAHVGHAIKISQNASEINVHNLTLDGNVYNFNFGGTWGAGANPYEREHDGIIVEDANHLSFADMEIKNFGRDGILILDNFNINQTIKTNTININNVVVNASGRNGLTWGGGHYLYVQNSTFKNSSTGFIVTNPGAGVDIEPEWSSNCQYGYFTNCVIDNNAGYGLSNGGPEIMMTSPTTANVYFSQSTIIGRTNYAGFTGRVVNLNFDYCNIYGKYQVSHNSDNLVVNNDLATHFRNCYFSDCYNGQQMMIPAADPQFLIAITAKRTLIDQCTVKSYFYPTYIISPGNVPCPTDASRPVIQRSNFYSYLASTPLFSNMAGQASKTLFSVNNFYCKAPVSFLFNINYGQYCNSTDGPNIEYPLTGNLPLCTASGRIVNSPTLYNYVLTKPADPKK
ncbi:MAG: right-handed parallel beta-helix repeat-containing protein [Ferruginibacter sp.]